jgi:RNA polymerase sigma factor (sigma-70 family)
MDERAIETTFERIYRSEARIVACQLRRCGVPPRDLDDATQEVFLVLFRRLAEVADAPCAGWLCGVARHVSRSYRRSTRRHNLESCTECVHTETTTVEDAESLRADDRLARTQVRRVVAQALARLDGKKREVILLTHVEELTAGQIARRIAASPHTVASRLRAARRQVQRSLRQTADLDQCA